MKGSKVGVLTFHRCINYGSYWQAKCLVEALQNRGHDAMLLDHYSGSVNIAEWKCAMNPVLPHESIADRKLYRNKIEKFFKCFESLPLSEKFYLENAVGMDNYDSVIIGSDEVWNLFHPWYGKKKIFWGENINADKIISYAASFGNYPAIWGLEKEWSDQLMNFDSISVRDENSYYIVKNATATLPEIVLDPCLQFMLKTDERDFYFDKEYIAVYGHNFSYEFINKIKRHARRKSLPLISIGYRNDWADEQWIDADPHDFALFFNNANSVATNFFHGCIFSLNYNKPFVCETSPYRNNKIYGLMKLVNGEAHLMSNNTLHEYETMLTSDVNEFIFKRIEVLRQSSNAYLDRALGMEQLQVA